MAFVEKNVTYKDLMKLSKSHLAFLVLDHRRSIESLHKKIADIQANASGAKGRAAD